MKMVLVKTFASTFTFIADDSKRITPEQLKLKWATVAKKFSINLGKGYFRVAIILQKYAVSIFNR